jgi:triosephosphate isomerase
MANAIGVELFAHSDDSVDELPPILYGGSVNAGNAAEIADIEGIDGVLVGGASLDGKTFGQIIREYCQ